MLSAQSLPNRLAQLSRWACAVGVGVWLVVLWAPAPSYPPPALPAPAADASHLAPVQAWFEGAQTRVRVEVLGLMVGGQGYGAALLSVDGAAAQAFRVGQELAPGVVLRRVDAQGVEVEQDGVVHTQAMAADTRLVPQGIVPAEPASPSHEVSRP